MKVNILHKVGAVTHFILYVFVFVVIIVIMEKRNCSKCKELLPLTSFKLNKSGMSRVCNLCSKSITTKTCSICGQEKQVKAFRLNKRGWSRRCKACISLQGTQIYKYRFVNLKLKITASEYQSIGLKARLSGFSVSKYVVFLHEKNMQKDKK
jgi:hypothetical protein